MIKLQLRTRLPNDQIRLLHKTLKRFLRHIAYTYVLSFIVYFSLNQLSHNLSTISSFTSIISLLTYTGYMLSTLLSTWNKTPA